MCVCVAGQLNTEMNWFPGCLKVNVNGHVCFNPVRFQFWTLLHECWEEEKKAVLRSKDKKEVEIKDHVCTCVCHWEYFICHLWRNIRIFPVSSGSRNVTWIHAFSCCCFFNMTVCDTKVIYQPGGMSNSVYESSIMSRRIKFKPSTLDLIS